MTAEHRLTRIAGKLWPALDTLDEPERGQVLRELIGIIYGSILAMFGLGWLVTATDLALVRAEWPTLLVMLILAAALNQLDFFWVVERQAGIYDRWSAQQLGGLVTISAALLFGPTALWLGVIVVLIQYVQMWRTTPLPTQRVIALRNLVLNVSFFSLGSLIGLTLYQRLGGSFPLPGLAWPAAPLAALAVLTLLVFDWICWSCYLLIAGYTPLNRVGALELGLFAKFQVVTFLPEFFAILVAAIYSRMGLGVYLFLIAGALLGGLMAQRLSKAAEQSGERSRELAQLEQLARAIIAAPPDTSTLPEMLAEFVPPMFLSVLIEIRLLGGQTLLHTPAQAPPLPAALWDWLRNAPRPHAVAVGERPSWNDQPSTRALAVAPIIGIDTAEALGGICVYFSPAVDDPAEALPALQSLAAQIASALYRAEEYAQTLAHQKVLQELNVAAEIQASFLPDTLPHIAGWQLAATLRPARQTSGDFYDILELPDGRLGLLIADVTDKGTGAALFMALSRTLIRTFAFEYPDQPDKALHAANKRILSDSRSSMFVTVFYGILDPARGTLTYCNAGHNPPYRLRDGAEPLPLRNTGIPLGITRDTAWTATTTTLEPGDLLILYTDGVSEAQNWHGELFEVERMLGAAGECPERTAPTVQNCILAAIDRFVGDAPQSDDLTLLVVMRDMADMI
ncbi:MAG TPA: PP2C family protein-serine/threonine phosphatase [Roseiflexaceae bacterium]|nr:PP2C family protein-serine/threonine phosphatase [Roseiflexaceae bacterium]